MTEIYFDKKLERMLINNVKNLSIQINSSTKKYVLAVDQGTSTSRAIVFNHHGEVIAMAQQAFTQYFPRAGWVEHDANEIWRSQLSVTRDVMQQLGITQSEAVKSIAAIGITNQRETTVIWNRRTGQPIHNALVWQDRRTAAECERLKEQGYAAMIQAKTGLVLDAYFSASKISWLLDNISGARDLAEAGELAFGTVDSWLLWNFTQNEQAPKDKPTHATDVSNASRTMLWNIHTNEWDDELLSLFRIPRALLPIVLPSSGEFGLAVPLGGIPIMGMVGDQQAAAFGQTCWKPGTIKNTYGTGCFMLCNTGEKVIVSQHNLLSSVAWQLSPSDKNAIQYFLEGSVFMAGATIQWLRELGIIQTEQEVEALANTVSDCDGVMMVPAHTGLGAPYWDSSARGTILGLTRGSNKGHIARAALEGIAHQVCDVLNAMKADLAMHAGSDISELRVDGGACQNNLLMQLQANLLQMTVLRPKITETTALGAAYLAGLAVGFWRSQNDISQLWQIDRRFEPEVGSEVWQRNERLRWSVAIEKSRGWV